MQALAFPLIFARKDVLVASHTGSGKTLAYLMPIFQRLKAQEAEEHFVSKPRRPRALVLSPTRELTEQIGMVAKQLAHHEKVRVALLNTGMKVSHKKRDLNGPVDVVVATPNNLLLQMAAGNIAIGDVQFLVIDEADTMFAQGFGDDLYKVIKPLRSRGAPFSTVLVSASMSREVKRFLQTEFPDMQHAETSSLHRGIIGTNHAFVPMTPGSSRLNHLSLLLRNSLGERVMVFCNSIASCRAVDHHLTESGLTTVCFHGDMPIAARKTAITDFTNPAAEGTASQPVLVCTDLAARGLDMPAKVAHVINFDMPSNSIDYLHRAGRTARAGASGTVTSLLQSAMDRTLGARIEKALLNDQPLDELSGLKQIKPAGPSAKEVHGKTKKGSNHRKYKKQEQQAAERAASGAGRGRGRGAAAGRGAGRGRSAAAGRGAGRGFGGGRAAAPASRGRGGAGGQGRGGRGLRSASGSRSRMAGAR